MAWTKAYVQANMLNQQPNQATIDFNEIVIDYAKGDAAAFNKAVAKYQDLLAADAPAGLNLRKIDFEALFNHARLFFWAGWMYVVAFALAALAWLGWSRPLNCAALGLIVFTFVLHTFALVLRIYISGRPPVTNLYSAAIFIGWGGVLLGMLLEVVYRLGIGNIIAGVAGFTTLLIADRLAGDGDTFTVLQAVLDTQFWLATHVTCITFGYATTYVAGLLGLVYILGGVLTPSLSAAKAHELARMIYGVICFAIFFSFVGTVLGGLWADDSWGRFRGWDPKENGALIIVLWNSAGPARSLGRHGAGSRPGRAGRAGQYHGQLVDVRREPALGRPALVWLYRGNCPGAVAVCRLATGRRRPVAVAEADVVEHAGSAA